MNNVCAHIEKWGVYELWASNYDFRKVKTQPVKL